MDAGDRRDQLGDRGVERGLEGQRPGQVVLAVRRVEVVVDRVAAHRDPRDLHQPHRILGRAVEPGIFRERPVAGLPRRVEHALDGDFRPGRDRDVDGLAGRHLQRLAHQPAHRLVLVAVEGLLGERAEDRRRVVADEQHRRHRRPRLPVLAIDVAGVVRGVEHAGELGLPLDLVAVDPGVEHPGLRIPDDQAADGDVFARIALRVLDDGQAGQVDLGPRQRHLPDRGVRARDLPGRQRPGGALAEAVEDLRFRPVGVHAEGEAQQLVLAEQVGDQRHVGPRDVLEAEDRPPVAGGELLLDHAGLVDRVDPAGHGREIVRPHLPGLGQERPQVLVHRPLPRLPRASPGRGGGFRPPFWMVGEEAAAGKPGASRRLPLYPAAPQG